MVEKPAKLKKCSVSENDVSILLQRYSPMTVLALLQEVAQVPEAKIDWKELVKTTSTGISNAREYQMLWRHLAYRHSLLDNLEDENTPLEDDSDLEWDLDPFPAVGGEPLSEAAACAKVFIASGYPSDSNIPSSSTIEAPLTIKLPRSHKSGAQLQNLEPTCSMQGMCITVPVSVQRQPILVPRPPILVQSSAEGFNGNGSSAEGFNGNGSSYNSNASRRKRKPWSEEEDMELIAAVKKCGEGSWANILRGDFLGDRTASQLSQRWAIIKKRHGNLNVGANTSGTQLSEVQLAARHAMSLALDSHVGNLKAARIIGSASSNSTTNGSFQAAVAASEQEQDKLIQSPIGTNTSPIGSSSLAAKSQATTSKKTMTKSTVELGSTGSNTSPIGSSSLAAKSQTTTSKKTMAISTLESDSIVRTAADAASEQEQDTFHQSPVGTNTFPIRSSSLAAKSQATTSKMMTKSTLSSDGIVRAAASEQEQDKSHQSPISTIGPPIGSSSLAAKSQVTTSKKAVTKSGLDSDSIVRAAAVAAGARIASPADAASIIKAAQSKNAIHIMAKVLTPNKTPTPGRGQNHIEAHSSIHSSNIKTALPSNNPTVMACVSRVAPVKITSPTTASSGVPMDRNNIFVSGSTTPLSSEKEIKSTEEIEGRGSGGVPIAQKNENCPSRQTICGRVKEEMSDELQPVVKKQATGRVKEENSFESQSVIKKQATEISNSRNFSSMAADGGDIIVEIGNNQAEDRQNISRDEVPASSEDKRCEKQSSVDRSKRQSTNGEGENRLISEIDGCDENSVVLSKAATNEKLDGNT